MKRCRTWAFPIFAVLAIAAVSSWPTVTHAQSARISPGQMHSEFEHAGLLAGPITEWWTGDAATFTVVDPRETGWRSRVLLVLVYRDASVAADARQQASSRDGVLVPGYGEPSWLGNVALVQSSPYELGHLMQAERDREQSLERGANADSALAMRVLSTVDNQFVAVVQEAASRVDL
jgi:hypothetical protein